MSRSHEVYADHASTTPPAPEVVEAMRPWLAHEGFGNASSVHRRGEAARDAVEHARAQVASLVGVTPEEIVFTASGSEANNLALKGLLAGATPERRRLVISAIEHPSVLETARYLESNGVPLTIVPVSPGGIVDLEAFERAMGPDVALASVMWVNNEVGTIQPVEAIAQLAHGVGARFHTDAVQAAGKLPVEAAAMGADLLSMAGHKLGGPLGGAALYVRRRTRLVPLVHGGHQERSRRAGTENLAAVVGLGVAAERAHRRLESGDVHEIHRLGDRLRRELLAAVPGSRLNGVPALGLASIVNIVFPGADGEAVLHELDREGVTVSTGSACSAATRGPSHVLLAMGLRPEDAHASVRFSLGDGSTERDVDAIVAAVPRVLERLRGLAAEPSSTPRPERGGGGAASRAVGGDVKV